MTQRNTSVMQKNAHVRGSYRLAFSQPAVDVLLLELQDRVGSVAKVAEKLAAGRVNVNFIYGSTGKGCKKSYIVLGTKNLKGAEKALGKH